ncbi:MAG: DUF4435 domain-containing protein [Aliarcobacter skirrowii]|uniref:DUF4435 domain-containing protein n=1 Tax=Aliarcobacter skirrowii TaxID=28200 RepID=UPI00242EACED|nr:DUF4435 domain-containing protein [Aliarcobacter skirrowii]MDD2509053.1 DUF4435 domain-containing protein [Aliarcobacter skirrowii]MDD3497035.1 DUF4435 domain-containing protein [Aliarcobacter skirrowii]
MSRVERLIEKTGVVASLWKQYKDRKKECSRKNITVNYFCFYEGKDDCKYYNTKIEEKSIYIQHFDCKGKYKLLEFKNYMDEEWSDIKNLIYFIDKDYDDKIKEDFFIKLKSKNNLYITPCYSIENFYTIDKVFEKIILNEFGYTVCCSEYNELVDKFNNLKNKFHSVIENINYFYATYRYFYEIGTISKKIILTDFKLNKYIDIDINTNNVFIKENLLIALENEIDIFPINFNNEYEKIKAKFVNPCCEFRGKFEIYFLEKFLNRIREEERYKNFNIDGSNMLSNLSQYALKPECLDTFIDNLKND